MKLIERGDDLRGVLDEARADARSVGFVPTMGSFHAGHRSLMQAARAARHLVVVSVFVNPTQFEPGEDFERYPRDPERDAAICEAEGVDVLFAPAIDEMYGARPVVTVHVAELTEGLCGVSRPHHFHGVATVVTKLLALVGPCAAYFGRKDFQQLVVVRRLASELHLPVEVVGCPLVREPDGLAMSTRNAYLEPGQRRAATVIYRALRHGVDAVLEGQRDPATLRRLVAKAITVEPEVRLEYAEVVRAGDLGHLEVLEGDVLVAVAARVGPSRLIDNVTIEVHGDRVDYDLGVIAADPTTPAAGAGAPAATR